MSKSSKLIYRLWEVCEDDWRIRAGCDQWWSVTARCPHGEWKGSSRGALDLDTALEVVVSKVEQGHGSAVARAAGDGWMHQCWKVEHEVWTGAGVPCTFCGRTP